MKKSQLNKLVKDLQNGDITAFDPVYYETKDLVYYTILSILKDPSLSEDIMQETYLKALEKIHSFKPSHSFQSWIVTIARNLAFNEYKKRKREFAIDGMENEFLFGSIESNSEKELIVKELLDTLDETERQILLLHVLGELKHREIAEILDKPLGTITWQYNKIINALKDKYESR